MEIERGPRFLRGAAIARRGRVRQLRIDLWSVPSQSGQGVYFVDLQGPRPCCSCKDFEAHGLLDGFACKHLHGVFIASGEVEAPAVTDEQQQEQRPRYSQHWPSYHRAQCHERDRVMALLHELCAKLPRPERKRGRPPTPIADVIFAATLREFCGFSSRRSASDIRAAHRDGFISTMVAPTTLTSRLDDPKLTPVLREMIRESAGPLASIENRFAIDSSGIGTSNVQVDHWHSEKWGGTADQDPKPRRKKWLKIHLCIGVGTLIATDVIVTSNGKGSGDAPQLPDLVAGTAGRFEVRQVLADGAYSSKSNLLAIESYGAQPFIPFAINTTGEGPAHWRRAFALFLYHQDTFFKHYGARSTVEAAFSSLKRKFRTSVRAKKPTAQRNEILARVLAWNLTRLNAVMCELGIDAEFWNSDRGGCHVH